MVFLNGSWSENVKGGAVRTESLSVFNPHSEGRHGGRTQRAVNAEVGTKKKAGSLILFKNRCEQIRVGFGSTPQSLIADASQFDEKGSPESHSGYQ